MKNEHAGKKKSTSGRKSGTVKAEFLPYKKSLQLSKPYLQWEGQLFSANDILNCRAYGKIKKVQKIIFPNTCRKLVLSALQAENYHYLWLIITK